MKGENSMAGCKVEELEIMESILVDKEVLEKLLKERYDFKTVPEEVKEQMRKKYLLMEAKCVLVDWQVGIKEIREDGTIEFGIVKK